MRRYLLFSAGCWLIVSALFADLRDGNMSPQPRINITSPTGGKIGTTVEVTITGTDLDDVHTLLFSPPDIEAFPLSPPAPPEQKTKAKVDPNKAKGPPVARFSVHIPPEAAPGPHEVRAVNKHGVSNPRIFVVIDGEQVQETEPNNEVEQAQKIDIGATVDGTIASPTDVDYFAFKGKAAQRLLITCSCAEIDSKLQPEMRLFTRAGQLVGFHRALPGGDGFLDATLPTDGEYLLRLNHFGYISGSREHAYRLTVSQTPHIDYIFPPMIEPGKATEVTLFGRNLPGGVSDPAQVVNGQVLEKLTVTIGGDKGNTAEAAQRLDFVGMIPPTSGFLDGFEYRLHSPAGISNPVLVTYAQAPIVLEKEGHNTPETAQELTVPCEVAGRTDKKHDRDWYVLTLKKGDVVMMELLSDRLRAPTDTFLTVRNAKNKQELVSQDDATEPMMNRGFYTVSRDPPPIRFVAPEDGTFQILVGDHLADIQADPRRVYRLRVTKERPDFRVIVMAGIDHRPETCIIGAGGQAYYNVHIHRQDNFKGDITLTALDLPAGITCPPQTIGAAQQVVRLVLQADATAPAFTGPIRVEATAQLNGETVTRQARPATISWPIQRDANLPTMTRLSHSLLLAVRDKAPGSLIAVKNAFTVALGDKLEIPLKLERISPEFKEPLQVQSEQGDIPNNVNFANLTFPPDKAEQKAQLTVNANALPGKYNLVLRGFANIAPAAKGKAVNMVLSSTPIQLNVVPKEVAKLSVDNANPSVKIGAEGTVLVRVARQFEYNGSFKVQLMLPESVKGLTAEDIVIPTGQNEAKLLLKVADDAEPANHANLTLKAVAIWPDDVTITHELKMNVRVIK